MFGGFKSSKCNTLCRMSVSRIKLLKNKRNITIKNMRREVAQLLRDKKTEYARIRVEAVMREDATNQVLEILELFLELVSVRVALIAKTKEMPHDMEEAIASIIYASKRLLELQELPQIAALFASKYGKQYVAEASSDEHADNHRVNQRLRQCLSVEPPDAMDKLQVLKDIGEEHDVEVDIPRLKAEMMPRVGQFTHMPVFSDEPGGATTMQGGDGQGGGLFMPGEIPGMVSTAPSEPPPVAAFRPAAGAAATAPPPAADQAPNLPPINPNFAPPVVPTEPTEPFAGALAAATGGAQSTELGSYPAIPGPGAGIGSKMYDTAKDDISYGMPAAAQPPPTSGGNMYVIPSADELQRRYDAAPGPPTKTTGAAPPSAPPPPAGTDLPSTPVTLPSAGGLSSMPAPPATDPSLPSAHNESVPGLPPQRPSADGSDLDDLQARWEALKRR